MIELIVIKKKQLKFFFIYKSEFRFAKYLKRAKDLEIFCPYFNLRIAIANVC